jgi:predicted aspartyl protease
MANARMSGAKLTALIKDPALPGTPVRKPPPDYCSWYTWAKENNMGEVRTEVTLVNIRDTVKAEEGIIPESTVRRFTVNAVVDTGAWNLVINEETREKLGLRVKRSTATGVAGGGTVPSKVTEPVATELVLEPAVMAQEPVVMVRELEQAAVQESVVVIREPVVTVQELVVAAQEPAAVQPAATKIILLHLLLRLNYQRF